MPVQVFLLPSVIIISLSLEFDQAVGIFCTLQRKIGGETGIWFFFRIGQFQQVSVSKYNFVISICLVQCFPRLCIL